MYLFSSLGRAGTEKNGSNVNKQNRQKSRGKKRRNRYIQLNIHSRMEIFFHRNEKEKMTWITWQLKMMTVFIRRLCLFNIIVYETLTNYHDENIVHCLAKWRKLVCVRRKWIQNKNNDVNVEANACANWIIVTCLRSLSLSFAPFFQLLFLSLAFAFDA